MKTLSLALAAAFLLSAGSAAPADSARIIRAFDGGWRFTRGDPAGAELPAYSDASWVAVEVPHDWAIAGPFSEANPAGAAGGFLPAGVGWYRKSFVLPPAWDGRLATIEFDGVMANSDVWINGFHLGHRPCGYSSFAYGLTGHLRPAGTPNVLAVRVDDSRQPASRWYAGAGINRHVRLVLTGAVRLQADRTFVTTPSVSRGAAAVRIASTVLNGSGADALVRIEELIYDSRRELAARTLLPPKPVPAGGSVDFAADLSLADPALWDVEAPTLYRAVTLVEIAVPAGSGCPSPPSWSTVDDLGTPFGIREARFDASTGFWLNGRNLKLKGVCLHENGGAFGAAIPLDVWRRRLAILKTLGVNAIRTAHNPPSPDFLDLCDSMGLLVMDEAFDCWTVGKNPYDYHLFFDSWSKADLAAMVRRDRNHPSIVLWSAGNEIHDTPNAGLSKGILSGLIEVFHQNDPTRPVTQALLRPNVSHDYTDGLADLLDVVGTNYRFAELLAAHDAVPSRRIVGTENGHEAAAWLAVRDNPAYSGEFIWSGIDYLGESRGWPSVASASGLLDRTGFPRPDGLIVQSWWSASPVISVFRRIAPTPARPEDPGYAKAPAQARWRRQVLFADWNPADPGPHEEQVEVYGNCGEVELLLNGRSLGSQCRHGDLSPLSWKVPYEPGVLQALGRNGGRLAAEGVLRTAGAPAAVRITADCSRLAPGWDQIATLNVEVVDRQGVCVPNAAAPVTFVITGPGVLVAVDSADNASHEPFQADRRRTFEGRCVAFLRATAAAGPITITAVSPGLRPSLAVVEAGPR